MTSPGGSILCICDRPLRSPGSCSEAKKGSGEGGGGGETGEGEKTRRVVVRGWEGERGGGGGGGRGRRGERVGRER